MLVAVVGTKGAPGATTTALALAGVWPGPGDPVLVVECDPAGADLPYLVHAGGGDRLDPHRGLTSLVAQARGRIPTRDLIADHEQRLDGGLQVLVGPGGPRQAQALGSPGWAALVEALSVAARGGDVLADCGRLMDPHTLARPVLAGADAVVVVARPTPASVAHLQTTIWAATQIRGGRPLDIGVVLVDDPGPLAQAGPLATWKRARGARQLDQVLDHTPALVDVSALGVLAWDPRTAAAWAGDGQVKDTAPLTATAATVAGSTLDWVQDLTGGAP